MSFMWNAPHAQAPRTTVSGTPLAHGMTDWRLRMEEPISKIFEAPPKVAPTRALLQVEQELLQPVPAMGSNPNVRSLEYWAFQYNRNQGFYNAFLGELEKKLKMAEYDAKKMPNDTTTRKMHEISSHLSYLYRAAAVAQNRSTIGR